MTSRRAVIGMLGLALAAAQFIRPARANPVAEPGMGLDATPVPQAVLAVLKRACYDCHSSETRWPWYANVAPVSWLVAADVRHGRQQLNFSRWSRYNAYDRADMLDEMCDQISTSGMPLWQYRLLHAGARLSEAEVAAVCAWTGDEAVRLIEEEQ